MNFRKFTPGVIYGTHRDTENFAYDLGLRLQTSEKLKDKILAIENTQWRYGDNYTDVAKRVIRFVKEGRPIEELTPEATTCLPRYQEWKNYLYKTTGPLVFDLHNSFPVGTATNAEFYLHTKGEYDMWVYEVEGIIIGIAQEHGIRITMPGLLDGSDTPTSLCEVFIPEEIKGSATKINPELIEVAQEFNHILTPEIGHALMRGYDELVPNYRRTLLLACKYLPYIVADPEHPTYQSLLDTYISFFEELFLELRNEMESSLEHIQKRGSQE